MDRFGQGTSSSETLSWAGPASNPPKISSYPAQPNDVLIPGSMRGPKHEMEATGRKPPPAPPAKSEVGPTTHTTRAKIGTRGGSEGIKLTSCPCVREELSLILHPCRERFSVNTSFRFSASLGSVKNPRRIILECRLDLRASRMGLPRITASLS